MQATTVGLVVRQLRGDNCLTYLIEDGTTRDAALVDPRADRVVAYLRELVAAAGFTDEAERLLTADREARTLMGNPELLLLDEPSEGLAPLVVDHLQEQIGRLKAEGLTILLAEQNVEFSLDLADRVYVLEKGHIRYDGTSREFRDNASIPAAVPGALIRPIRIALTGNHLMDG